MGLHRRVDSIKERNERKRKQEELSEMATESQLGIVELSGMVADDQSRLDDVEQGIVELMKMIGGN